MWRISTFFYQLDNTRIVDARICFHGRKVFNVKGIGLCLLYWSLNYKQTWHKILKIMKMGKKETRITARLSSWIAWIYCNQGAFVFTWFQYRWFPLFFFLVGMFIFDVIFNTSLETRRASSDRIYGIVRRAGSALTSRRTILWTRYETHSFQLSFFSFPIKL